MDELQFEYAGICHSAVGALVGFKLRRRDRGEFIVILTPHDAERLCSDLSVQVRIARGPSQ